MSKPRTSLKAIFIAGLAIAMAASAGSALAQKKVKWKMQSAFGATLPHLGTSGVRFAKNVSEASDGKFEIKFYEPGALVPALECFDAVSKGSVDACWTTPGYHTGKIGPAVSFFTAVPFGPSMGEYLAWKIFGGGDQIRNEIYAKHGVLGFNALVIGPETSGWFKEPVKSLDSLKGMKMRFFGLGAQVMQKLGVSTQLLAAADIYPALERGVIDSTEFSMPSIDQKLGFYQIAKNNYFPGWHQYVSVNEFLVNKKAYEKLSKANKMILQLALGETISWGYAETEWRNPTAMNENVNKHGVKNIRWTDEQLAAFEKAWDEVLAELSAKDETFKKVAESYTAFRKQYKVWGEAQALKPTYLP